MRVTVPGALAALVLIVLAVPAPSGAQEPLAGSGLEQEVRQLNATLGRLVELLSRQLESTNAAVLMQRVQLMTARIEPLEIELRAARAGQEELERQLDEWEISARTVDAQIDDALGDPEMEEHGRYLQEHERQMIEERKKQVEDRLWTARQRVIDLEQRLDERRAEIETWEGEIDRVLGLR